MDLDFDKRFGSERVGAYERLLLDVIDDQLNLFVRSDEQEEAWRWVEPMLDYWAADAQGPRPIRRHLGPSAASAMIARDAFCWSEEIDLHAASSQAQTWKPTMLDRIQAAMPSLAPAEQRVARLCLTDPRAFAKLPVSVLADRAHVSKPTVVRFCRSVGYDGLSDFKRKLAGTVNEGVPFIHRSVDADDKTADVMVKVVDNTVAAFLKYRNEASTIALDKALAALMVAYQTSTASSFMGGQFGRGGAGCPAQVLSPGRETPSPTATAICR